jgi:O-antigen ligase
MSSSIDMVTICLLFFPTVILTGLLIYYPVTAIVFLCFLAPWTDILSGELRIITSILGLLTVSGYLLIVVHSRNIHQSHINRYLIDYLIMLLLVLSIILPDPGYAFKGVDIQGNNVYYAYTYIQLAILYYLASRLIYGNSLSWVGLGLMLGTMLSSLYAIKFMGGVGVFDQTPGLDRLEGAQGDPNSFAALALCGIALLPAAQKLCRYNWQIIAVTLLGSFQIVIVLLTLSKTGILALSLLLLLWLIFYKLIPFIKYNIIIGIGILFISTLIIPRDQWIFIYDNIVDGIFYKEGSMGTRYNLWYGAYLAFKSAPIWGIGLGKFPWYVAQQLHGFEIKYGYVVHNAYITILAENGIVGITFYMGMISLAVYRFWVVFWNGKSKDLRISGFSGLSAFIMILVMSLTLSIQYNKLLWLLAGTSIALSTENNVIKLQNEIPSYHNSYPEYDTSNIC